MKTRIFWCTMGLTAFLFAGCGGQQSRMGYIGAESAKRAALEAASLSEQEVSSVSTDMGTRDGLDYYQVSFEASGQKYQYDIDALTGVVISVENFTDAEAENSAGAGNSAEAGNIADAGSSAGAENPVGAGNAAGTGNSAGAVNISGVGSSAGVENSAGARDTADAGNSAGAGNAAGTGNSAEAGNAAGTGNSAGAGNAAGTENTAGAGNAAGTGSSAGAGNTVDAGSSAGAENSAGTGSSQTGRIQTSGRQAAGSQGSDSDAYIGEEEARRIALEHAGLEESQVTFVRSRLEFDDGQWGYDVEFYTADYEEYDYEIDAYTGAVISFDFDAEHYAPQSDSSGAITPDQAKQLALGQVPGASESDIREFKTDYDDGILQYEGEIIYNGMEYEFEIDAYSGLIREWSAEPVGR